jgi:uncharacterized membrane protein YeaQ/YmgE (transglycosylase-associated protein family)
MGLLGLLFLGGIAGWLASIIAGTNAKMGLFANIIVGVLGAMVGGIGMSILGGTGVTGFNIYSLFVAVAGSSVLLFLFKRIAR